MADIYSMTRAGLEEWFSERGENPAKAGILFQWLYQRDLHSFDELPFSDRVKSALTKSFTLELPETAARTGDELTEKLLLRLPGNDHVETVLMRQKYGDSVCISTQVGCSMGCAFCQSGRLKKRRSLTAGEMIAQVLKIRRLGAEIHSVTVMGIGEPFDNFSAVKDFCEIATDYKGLALGEKHITVSTCGILPGIKAWSALPHPCSLAVSLHAADNKLRSELMPINRRYPVEDVIAAAAEFAERHNRRVTLEYVMLSGVNDSPEQARQLAELIGFCKRFYVNIIPYNGNDSGFTKSSRERIMAFYDVLKKHGISVTMRREFGGGISAACGQLSSDFNG
ncbi:MAG: 23S rRNA (adenine(2503)-C(2))-methyltransferase RlmN [Oscillospiraceae bacterium]|nr:23S rRNA (adenine(2503)-C(2))-methyltransferase RlmN [Oscillospiraceae bacterium]